MVIKMLALTVRGYFKSHWNKLDFFIIVMATAGEFNLYVPRLYISFRKNGKNNCHIFV